MDIIQWVASEILQAPSDKVTEREAGYYSAVLKVYDKVGHENFTKTLQTQAILLRQLIDDHDNPSNIGWGWQLKK